MALDQIPVEGAVGEIVLNVARPSKSMDTGYALLLCHGLPLSRGGGRIASRLLPELAEHISAESGWAVATTSLRGVGVTAGTFSASGWRSDLNSVIGTLVERVNGISLAGFGFGGSLALRVTAESDSVRGVASLAAPADLRSWCGTPETFSEACHRAGVVGDEPLAEAHELMDDVLNVDPLGAAAGVPPRRMMVVHGADDAVVPSSEARRLVDAADGHAELRIIQGAGHWLRADPRMVATLLGWLDRQR